MGKVIKHLAQCWTHSRPSMNDPGSRMVWQPRSEIESDPHVEAIFHVHCVYTSRFLPIPFLFWNGENSSFSSDFQGLFWAWQRRETHRWSPEQLKTGGSTRQKQEVAASWGPSGSCGSLCQISLSVLSGAAPEHCGALLTQEHMRRQEEGLP